MLAEVIHTQRHDVINFRGQHNQGATIVDHTLQSCFRGLGGRGFLDTEVAQHVDTPSARPVRQSLAQSGSFHLFRGVLGVVTRLRTVYGAAASELRGANGALTSPAGTLLAPRLLAAAGDVTTSLGGVGPLTSGRQLGVYDLVYQGVVKVEVENKSAIEEIFKVKVASVNTQNREGKRVRTRTGWGKRNDTKRAIVTLKEGSIDVFGMQA